MGQLLTDHFLNKRIELLCCLDRNVLIACNVIEILKPEADV